MSGRGSVEASDLEGVPAEVRWRVSKALGRLGRSAVPPLVQALQDDPDPAVRQFAAESLGRIGPPARDAIPALRRAMARDGSASVQGAAERALAVIGGEL